MKDLKKVIIDTEKEEIRDVFYMCRCEVKKAFEIIESYTNDNKDLQEVLQILYVLNKVADDKVICFV